MKFYKPVTAEPSPIIPYFCRIATANGLFMQSFRKNCTTAQGFKEGFADNMRKKQKFLTGIGPLDKRNNLLDGGKNGGEKGKSCIFCGFLLQSADQKLGSGGIFFVVRKDGRLSETDARIKTVIRGPLQFSSGESAQPNPRSVPRQSLHSQPRRVLRESGSQNRCSRASRFRP